MKRKHQAKHAARMLRWPKRALALCAAMLLVCSCLLPAFANGTDEAAEPAEYIAEAGPGAEQELWEDSIEPLAETDDLLLDEGFGVDAEEPDAEPVTEPLDDLENPVEDDEDDTGSTSAPGKVSTDADGNIVITYDPVNEDFADGGVISRPEEGMELDPGFAIPTNLYRFWLKEMDAYELTDIAREAASAELSETDYLARYGDKVGLYASFTAADGANLEDYRVSPPSSVDDPEGNSRSFAGWYTIDELGERHKFTFDTTLYLSSAQTVDVFAAWEEPSDGEEASDAMDTDAIGGSLLEAGTLGSLTALSAGKAADDNTIKVYVYVATTAKDGSSWANNEEFLDLLQIDPDTIDGNGYFPVGIIDLDRSFLNGKGQAATTPGEPLITNDADWTALMDALSVMDTDSMDVAPYTANNGNKVGRYLSQASRDYNMTWGSQRTALFRWNMTESYGFQDQSVQYHLDLQFNTNQIKFITGNNGITFPDYARDWTEVDSRTYITGSEIQSPRNLQIPAGYKFMGYYEDPDFTIPWDKIGTPLNEDETVYIKITPNANVVLQYVVAEGQGTVLPDNEVIVRGQGEAVGSTAEPASGWAFDGWYYDEACQEPVPEELVSGTYFTPTEPEDGWKDAVYYAKFIQSEKPVEITKTVTGLMGEHDKRFYFEVTDAAGVTHGFSLTHGQSTGENSTIVLTAKAGDTLTLKETNAAGYSVKAVVSCKDGATQTVYAPEQLDEETKTLTLEITEEMLLDEGVQIEVCNDRDLIPDSGVLLDAGPYGLLLGLAAAGLGVQTFRRRRGGDAD